MILFLVLSLSLSLSRRARSNQIEELTRLVRKYENWAREGASETLSALSCDVLKLALREPLLPGFLRALHLEGAAAGLARLAVRAEAGDKYPELVARIAQVDPDDFEPAELTDPRLEPSYRIA